VTSLCLVLSRGLVDSEGADLEAALYLGQNVLEKNYFINGLKIFLYKMLRSKGIKICITIFDNIFILTNQGKLLTKLNPRHVKVFKSLVVH